MTQVAAAAPAANSSFYLAMRILPAPRREAMFAVYGFCREVDDIADERGPATASQRLKDLERWRGDVAAMFAGRAPPKLASLDRATREFNLQQADFDAVIDGMAMDAAEDIRAPDWATLDLYCDRVASAVGRLSVRIFGLAPEPGEALAHVFKRFYRVDGSRSREQGGAGLGLSIVESICSAHGAQVEVSSAPGKGSTFRVRAPLAVGA